MKLRISAVLVMAAVALSYGAEKMSYEQYESELNTAIQKEQGHREEISREQGQIESLKQQIADIDQRIASVIQEKYSILGITEQDISDVENQVATIKQQLESLSYLSGQELKARASELKALEQQLAAIKKKPASNLDRISRQIADAEAVSATVRQNMNKPVETSQKSASSSESASSSYGSFSGDSYTVQLVNGERESLTSIAQQVYGDPFAWPRIYRANKEKIDRGFQSYTSRNSEPKYVNPPDFIYPGQTLVIPR